MDKDNLNDSDKGLPSYSEYILYANKMRISSRFTKDEYLEFTDIVKAEKGDVTQKQMESLGFAFPFGPKPAFKPMPNMPVAPSAPAGPGGPGIPGISGFSAPVNFLFGAYETLADPEVDVFTKLRTITKVIDDVTSGGGNEGNIKRGDIPASNVAPSNSQLAVNYKPNAIDVKYEPPIPNTVYSNYYRTNDFRDSNVYISQLELQMPQGDPRVDNYIQNILIPNLQTRANVAVNFDVKAGTTFTYQKITSYLETVMKAMQTYYSISNILTYCAATTNNNSGMYALRKNFTAQSVQNLQLLSERLNNIPIPPRMRELCYWMSNIYKATDECPNSPILMITPLQLISNGYDDENGYSIVTSIESNVNDLIDALNPTYSTGAAGDFDGNLINMLAKICPGWLGTDMGAGAGVPLYDTNWMDLWSNSPSSIITADSSQTSFHVPFVYPSDDRAKEIPYVAFGNVLSGMSQALFSAKMGVWSGLIKPLTSATFSVGSGGTSYIGETNRFIFANSEGKPDGEFFAYYGNVGDQLFSNSYTSEGSGGDYPKSQSAWYNHPAQATENNDYNSLYIPCNAQRIQGFNFSSNEVPSYMSTRWLMSFDEALKDSKSSTKPMRSRKGKRSMDKETDD